MIITNSTSREHSDCALWHTLAAHRWGTILRGYWHLSPGVHVWVREWVCVCARAQCVYLYLSVWMCVSVCVCAYVCVCICPCVNVSVWCVCVCIALVPFSLSCSIVCPLPACPRVCPVCICVCMYLCLTNICFCVVRARKKSKPREVKNYEARLHYVLVRF